MEKVVQDTESFNQDLYIRNGNVDVSNIDPKSNVIAKKQQEQYVSGNYIHSDKHFDMDEEHSGNPRIGEVSAELKKDFNRRRGNGDGRRERGGDRGGDRRGRDYVPVDRGERYQPVNRDRDDRRGDDHRGDDRRSGNDRDYRRADEDRRYDDRRDNYRNNEYKPVDRSSNNSNDGYNGEYRPVDRGDYYHNNGRAWDSSASKSARSDEMRKIMYDDNSNDNDYRDYGHDSYQQYRDEEEQYHRVQEPVKAPPKFQVLKACKLVPVFTKPLRDLKELKPDPRPSDAVQYVPCCLLDLKPNEFIPTGFFPNASDQDSVHQVGDCTYVGVRPAIMTLTRQKARLFQAAVAMSERGSVMSDCSSSHWSAVRDTLNACHTHSKCFEPNMTKGIGLPSVQVEGQNLAKQLQATLSVIFEEKQYTFEEKRRNS